MQHLLVFSGIVQTHVTTAQNRLTDSSDAPPKTWSAAPDTGIHDTNTCNCQKKHGIPQILNVGNTFLLI